MVGFSGYLHVNPVPDGPKYLRIAYSGFAYEESKFWFWVDSFYLRTWTLRVWVSLSVKVTNPSGAMDVFFSESQTSGWHKMQNRPLDKSLTQQLKAYIYIYVY